MQENSELIEGIKSQPKGKKDVWSSLPVVGKHIDARRDFMQKRGRYSDYNLTTRKGQQRELDIIEEASGLRFRVRPNIEWSNVPQREGVYIYGRNVMELYPGLMRPADRRAMLWHEAGHAFVMQSPRWAEFSPESLSPTDLSNVDPFILMRNAVINEGLAMVIQFQITDRLLPYLSKADASNLLEIKREYLEPIDKEEFLSKVLKTQDQVAEGIKEQKSVDTQDINMKLEESLRRLVNVGGQATSIMVLIDFLDSYGRRLGYNYLSGFVDKTGINDLDALIKALAENPPQNWEGFFRK